ncbi:MAG: alpha/beta hydrolase [Bacteroidales bacterium]|jgi:pimeloyl-ACP methyl ester carboxylesterase
MRAIIPILISQFFFLSARTQEKVSFYADDSLKITADLYLKDYNKPFILLFHQGGSSRGEYNEIAARLMKLDYNCLSVDLRSGGKINYVANETAQRAELENYPRTFTDARKDIEAAIRYIKKFNAKPVILFGSSYSASLCLIIANETPDVSAIIAFSPGEYFRPQMIVKDKIKGLQKPLFVASSTLEFDYIEQMFAGVQKQYLTIYKPPKGKKGVHGAKSLWQESESSDECWLELLLFFKKIRPI